MNCCHGISYGIARILVNNNMALWISQETCAKERTIRLSNLCTKPAPLNPPKPICVVPGNKDLTSFSLREKVILVSQVKFLERTGCALNNNSNPLLVIEPALSV